MSAERFFSSQVWDWIFNEIQILFKHSKIWKEAALHPGWPFRKIHYLSSSKKTPTHTPQFFNKAILQRLTTVHTWIKLSRHTSGVRSTFRILNERKQGNGRTQLLLVTLFRGIMQLNKEKNHHVVRIRQAYLLASRHLLGLLAGAAYGYCCVGILRMKRPIGTGPWQSCIKWDVIKCTTGARQCVT